MAPITTSTSSATVSRRALTQPQSSMSSEKMIKYYTERLVLRIEPEKALRRLWTTGTSMKLFEEFGTEKVLKNYDNDYELWSLVNQLREKFTTLRRREARDAKLKAQKNGVPTLELEAIEETMEKAKATKKTAVNSVDYPKYKIVKRSLALHKATPRSKNSVHSSSSSSSSGSADVSPNYN